MRPGTRVVVDVGAARVGVARSDRDGLLATPVETVPGDARAVTRVVELADEVDAVEIVVGLPVLMSGQVGAAAEAARRFAVALAAAAPGRPVRLVDERLSTVSATAALRSSGVPGRKQRAVVDQAAAVVILQTALDQERSTGRAVGELVEVGS